MRKSIAMTSRQAHRDVLAKSFTASFRTSEFSGEELDVISKHGAWMEALACGQIRPITLAQQHFLEVASGSTEPKSTYERIWLKLQIARDPQPVSVTQVQSADRSPEEAPPTKPDAAKIIELARADKLTSLQLSQVVDRSSEFGFTKDQLSELQRQIQKRISGASRTRSTCTYCQGDGGPGGRCHHCSGNGFAS